MDPLPWILGGGVAMTAIALTGSVVLVLREDTLKRLLLPMVALAAGSLLGGALFHRLPASLGQGTAPFTVFAWTAVGFLAFFALEQLLHWHHCHHAARACRQPLSYLILLGDGLHNFLGGLAIGRTFLIDVRTGIAAWLAAAAHEVPQEIGDFGVLPHAGWSRGRALLYNALSGATFLVGGIVAWAASRAVDVGFLLPLAAGNFLYIAASDLVPEIHHHARPRTNVLHFASFTLGLALMALFAQIAA